MKEEIVLAYYNVRNLNDIELSYVGNYRNSLNSRGIHIKGNKLIISSLQIMQLHSFKKKKKKSCITFIHHHSTKNIKKFHIQYLAIFYVYPLFKTSSYNAFAFSIPFRANSVYIATESAH